MNECAIYARTNLSPLFFPWIVYVFTNESALFCTAAAKAQVSELHFIQGKLQQIIPDLRLKENCYSK